MRPEQQEDEVRAFVEFVRVGAPGVDINSIESKGYPNPDVLCSDCREGTRAFELTELIDPIFARDLCLCSATKIMLENYFRYLDPNEAKAFEKKFAHALLYFQFSRAATLHRREKLIPVALRKLLKSADDIEDLPLHNDPTFKGFLQGVSIARGTWPGPVLDCNSGGSKGNPISATLASKLSKKYSAPVPVELLAYIDGNLLIPDEILLDSLRDYLGSAKKPLPFSRIWVFDLRDRKVKFCCDTEAQSLTPHTADGRCRHAACRARGAPARQGGDRGRS